MWHISPTEAADRWANIKGLVFDWDGVFNSGQKTSNSPSGFFEADSMGVNMLRFSMWLKNAALPPTAIITGADNPGAIQWAEREHPNALYSKVLNKQKQLEVFCETYGILPNEVAFFYDDILDLNAGKIAGMRIQIGRPGSLHFQNYCVEMGLADFTTKQKGGDYGLREACDELLVLGNAFEKVIAYRMKTDGEYSSYLQARNQIKTQYHHQEH
jgi:3-deoxy-D-manno-octulosonate 8-phosphate phosphatase (KDO 8-P phosphatase)